MPSTAPEEFYDFVAAFPAGVNAGVAPALLPKDQLANALNTTVRGTFVKPRPPYQKLTIGSDSQDLLDQGLATGPYQGGCYFQPDNDDEGLMISVGGRLFQITPSDNSYAATVRERTIPGDPNPASQPQAWMWQSEKWVNVNDGSSLTIFVDGVSARRSTYNSPTNYASTLTTTMTIPATGSAGSADFASVLGIVAGTIVTVQNYGTIIVNSVTGSTVAFTNQNMVPASLVIPIGTVVNWTISGTELPPGRQGAYGIGRNWIALVDGKQFVASDLVGGSSGTQAENFRDAVLNITENTFLTGGGNFAIPGSLGEITFMCFSTTLDASLGQGPLQVGTHSSVFSCNAPVDRTIWQSIQNPILTQSQIANGGLGQYSTINVNGDIIMRSLDGIRSLVLARREFNTWGNTPISREIEPFLSKDSPDLLPYGSAVFFDNRMLMTAQPVSHAKGIYHNALVAMNCDPISSLRGKAPAVWDATMWTGPSILQIFRGEFSGVERCFCVCLNTTGTTPFLEVYELLKSASRQIQDNQETDIVWTFETPVLFNQVGAPNRKFLQLWDGELHVDDLQGTVRFQVWYKPDQYPCWTPWFAWEECQLADDGTSKPQFRPQMGFGQPSIDPCDATTNRPLREGWGFQIKVVVEGHCRILGIRVKAKSQAEPAFAPQSCNRICNS